MNAIELKALIRAAKDQRSEAVAVPEWGIPDGLFIATLSAADRGLYEHEMVTVDQKTGKQRYIEGSMATLRQRLVSRCLVDETGTRIFTDAEIAELGAKDSTVLIRLFDIANRVNGMDAAEVAKLEKNSVATQGEDSSLS